MSTGVREPLCSPALSALWGATPVWGGGFPPWPSENRHETHVTTKSQSSGFLKRETRQTWQCSFPLGPWDSWGPAPAEPAAPTCLCGEGASPTRGGEPHSRGQRRVTPAPWPRAHLRLLAPWPSFISFLRRKKPRSSWLGTLELRSLSPAQKGRRKRPPRRGPATCRELGHSSTRAFCWGPRAWPRPGAPMSAPRSACLQGQGGDFTGLSRGSGSEAPRAPSYRHVSYLPSGLRQGQSSVISQLLHPWSQ